MSNILQYLIISFILSLLIKALKDLIKLGEFELTIFFTFLTLK